MDSELLPCPHCGRHGMLLNVHRHEGGLAWKVACTGECNAWRTSMVGAIAEWNRHTPPESAVESQPEIFEIDREGRLVPGTIIHDSESQPIRSPEGDR